MDGSDQGLECLRLLNEIIADFDEVGFFSSYLIFSFEILNGNGRVFLKKSRKLPPAPLKLLK